MATLIDEEIGRQEDDNVEQLDALASEEQPSEEDNVPDKYRNKSAAELVQSTKRLSVCLVVKVVR